MKKHKKKTSIIFEKEEYYHNSKFNLKICNSNIKNGGKGVFTQETIQPNTFIDYYTGDLMYEIKCGTYYVEIDDTCGINAICFPRCYMAMINDAYNTDYINNCEIRINKNVIEIWSIEYIKENEELFLSYGNQYWK